ncbi:hypothetical protein HPB47_018046, partial [Ixodes persulcatus]
NAGNKVCRPPPPFSHTPPMWQPCERGGCSKATSRTGLPRSVADAPLVWGILRSAQCPQFAGDTESQQCWTAPTACLQRRGRLQDRPPCESARPVRDNPRGTRMIGRACVLLRWVPLRWPSRAGASRRTSLACIIVSAPVKARRIPRVFNPNSVPVGTWHVPAVFSSTPVSGFHPGRDCVPSARKTDLTNRLANNRDQAETQLRELVSKLQQDEVLLEDYDITIRQYLQDALSIHVEPSFNDLESIGGGDSAAQRPPLELCGLLCSMPSHPRKVGPRVELLERANAFQEAHLRVLSAAKMEPHNA